MVIGIDASRAFVDERTGTEQYSYQLITHILRLPASKKHHFVLFIRPNARVPSEIAGYSNVSIKTVAYRYLWTQVGLARETWKRVLIEGQRIGLDVLWVPAHTLPILRKAKLKTVVTIHGLEYKWLPEYQNWLQRWYLPLSTYYAAIAANSLICVSESTKRDLINETGIDIDKIIVIHEGVNFSNSAILQVSSSVNKLYAKYGIENKKYVLFVGTVQPRKNVGALIAAFAKVRQAYPDYKLVVAGGVGWRAELDLGLAAKLGIPEGVVFTGRVESVVLRALYRGAALYVQPSWTEGFGLPILEAMRIGVPVIVSDGGAMPEVVGGAGIVVSLKRDFVTKLAGAMERVLGDRALQNKMINGGRLRSRQLTWERAAKMTLEVLVRG